jgi:dipeptidyl-peptidase 4
MRTLLAVLAFTLCLSPLVAQDYAQAERYSASYLRERTYSTTVTPNWIGETDRFWYSYQDRFGRRYHLVDPKAGTKSDLFDHARLAADLSVAVRQPLDAEQMQLSRGEVDEQGKVFSFRYADHKFELELATGELTDKGELTDEDRKAKRPRRIHVGGGVFITVGEEDEEDEDKPESDTHRSFAPDHTAYVFARGHDLYYVEASDEVKAQIATIVERRKAEKEAEKKAAEEAKEAAAGVEKEEDKKGEEEEEEEDKDKRKVETVQVKPLGESAPARETDERLKWAEQVDERDALRLTDDGEERYSFAGRGPGRRRSSADQGQVDDFEYDDYAWELEYDDPWAPEEKDEPEPKTRPSINWAPDSSAFHATRRDGRGIADLFLVNSIAEPRPALETYPYPMPGEDKVWRSELHVFNREKLELTQIKQRWKDEQYRSLHWVERENQRDELRLLRQDRLVRNLEYGSLDTASGEISTLLEEGFEAANVSPQGARYLEERDEFIWWSDRTGWGHFYLYDGKGKLKNAITSGKWRSSRIIDVDEEKGLLFFRGNGREEGENIYYEHTYRVYLDGSGLACMDPVDATHRSVLSPTKSFLVDNCSRIDMAPVSILRDAEGKPVLPLEEADLSRLYEAGWAMPETFTVKAADGVTDLFGNMWKPFDFDPERSYPIIAEVYPGPQTEGVSHSFSSSNGRQQLAQVGFIVIQVGHRGGTPGRSKAYHSYGYFNLRDYGLEDKKSAIEQLAARHPFIDIERVGLYGHSGGGFMTAAAMMVPPYNDFFKVGVSSAGNHDNNIYNNYWSERYHGLKEVEAEKDKKKVAGKAKASPGEDKEKKEETHFEIHIPTTQELAANLKGNLLLVHGEIDNNVHPANTMRLVNALIKAGKRFDLLIIPGARHGFGSANTYFNQRKWEFFAEHLLGDHQVGADIVEKVVGSE